MIALTVTQTDAVTRTWDTEAVRKRGISKNVRSDLMRVQAFLVSVHNQLVEVPLPHLIIRYYLTINLSYFF